MGIVLGRAPHFVVNLSINDGSREEVMRKLDLHKKKKKKNGLSMVTVSWK